MDETTGCPPLAHRIVAFEDEYPLVKCDVCGKETLVQVYTNKEIGETL